MNAARHSWYCVAFSLIELLVVIAVICVLLGLLFPARSGPSRAYVAVCSSNLKEIGANFEAWSQQHEGLLPMQVATTNGGSMELIATGSAFAHFRTLTNSGVKTLQQSSVYVGEGKPYRSIVTTNLGIRKDRLVCPSDKNRRDSIYREGSVAEMVDTNLSYFVGLDSSLRNPQSILAGDRHLQVNGQQVGSGLFVTTPNSSLGWTRELHPTFKKGNFLFADGHVEFVKKPIIAVRRQGLAASRLAIP